MRNSPKAFLLLVLSTLSGCSALAPHDPTADRLSLTVAAGPLANEAYKAQLSLAYGPPERLRAGETYAIHLLVKNSSAITWPCAGQADGRFQINVANRWWDQEGKRFDDSRVALPYDLNPGESAEVLLSMKVPGKSGNYTLEFDLVQEQVAWFSERGSETLRINVVVDR